MTNRQLFWPCMVGVSFGALAGCGGEEGPTPQALTPPSSAPAPAPTLPPPSGTGTVTLAWFANSEPDLQGYRIYYGTTSGVYTQVKGAGVEVGRVVEYQVQGLTRGATYYFTMTAYDRSGNESGFGAEVPAPVP